MFNFEHTKLNQEKFEQLAQLLIHHKSCYTNFKLVLWIKLVEINLPLKTTAVFKKERATRIPLQLKDWVQQFLDVITHCDIYAPVNTDFLITGKTIFNSVLLDKQKESLKNVLDARQFKTVIDET